MNGDERDARDTRDTRDTLRDTPRDPARDDGDGDGKPPPKRLGAWLLSLAGLGARAGSLRESVEELIEEHAHDASTGDGHERAMLLNLLKFGELRVEDVMVPRADIVAAPAGASLEDVVETMARAGHSRLPVYRESLDDIVGMVHVRDLLAFWPGNESAGRPFDLAAAARAIPFVPPSMPIDRLLRQMRATRVHMALVVDEHGGTDGLATIEDLVEEIVGEIEDEHDRATPPFLTEREDGGWDASARVRIEDLESKLDIDLLPAERDEQIDTLGGLIFALAGRVPKTGETIAHESGVAFRVVEADRRRIRRIRVIPAKAAAP